MAIPGTVTVTSIIAPTSTGDTYPVTDTIYSIDGLRNVSNNIIRNAIPNDRRRQGMIVGVNSTGSTKTNYWSLLPSPWTGTDSDWTPFSSSSGTTSGDFLPYSGTESGKYMSGAYLVNTASSITISSNDNSLNNELEIEATQISLMSYNFDSSPVGFQAIGGSSAVMTSNDYTYSQYASTTLNSNSYLTSISTNNISWQHSFNGANGIYGNDIQNTNGKSISNNLYTLGGYCGLSWVINNRYQFTISDVEGLKYDDLTSTPLFFIERNTGKVTINRYSFTGASSSHLLGINQSGDIIDMGPSSGLTSGGTNSNQVWTSGTTGLFSIRAINDSTIDATGNYSYAEGYATTATGATSHVEGNFSRAYGLTSHAEGDSTQAIGSQSHAEGFGAVAIGTTSHAEGDSTQAIGNQSHAEGVISMAIGNNSHAEGNRTIASGITSHAEGSGTTASGNYSHSEGLGTIASGIASHAGGSGTTASGAMSQAIGQLTVASGANSFSSGQNGNASGINSFTTGISNLAVGGQNFVSGNANKSGAGINNFIAGGTSNTITGTTLTALNSFIGGGASITITGSARSIAIGTNTGIIMGGNQNSIIGGANNNIYLGINSSILGGNNNTLTGGTGPSNSIIIGGSGNTLTGNRSVILGGSGMTVTANDTAYVPNLVIKRMSVPSSSADPIGEAGSISWDDTYFYWRTTTQWLRITGSTF